MIESFVDLTYRGLALGRRIKLTQVRPTTGYLELPMPMPVGTLIAINTDEGVQLEAVVTAIHEQTGGSDRVPGMIVKPTLAAEAALSWWQARVGLPEESDNDKKGGPTRDRPITVRPRTHTVPAPPPVGETVALTKEVTETKELSVLVDEGVIERPPEPQVLTKEVTETKELSVFVAEQAQATPPTMPAMADPPQYEEPPARPKLKEEDVKRTMVMNAVDQELLAKLTQRDGEVEALTATSSEHPVVDDGLRTTVMDTPDPAALGFEVSASGTWRVAEPEGDDDDEPSPSGTNPGIGAASDKPKGKKRKKRR